MSQEMNKISLKTVVDMVGSKVSVQFGSEMWNKLNTFFIRSLFDPPFISFSPPWLSYLVMS